MSVVHVTRERQNVLAPPLVVGGACCLSGQHAAEQAGVRWMVAVRSSVKGYCYRTVGDEQESWPSVH